MTAVDTRNETTDLAVNDREAENRRKLALLRAVGLDRVSAEQRELALAIAKRYDLDLLLKHLVLIDGKPYVTRDALLWIAHRDGHLDGIEVTEPVIRDYQGTDYWYAEASVYRKDMSRPFKYGGRYPVKGQNAKFGPEMATKVAEAMALRRAFNISAPTQDERWDVDVPATEPEKPRTLAEKAAERAAAIEQPDGSAATEGASQGHGEAEAVEVNGETASTDLADADYTEVAEEALGDLQKAPTGVCGAVPGNDNKLGLAAPCALPAGHPASHRSAEGSWK